MAEISVFVRQAVEGRKAELFISREALDVLSRGGTIEASAHDDDAAFEDTTTDPDGVDEPTQLVRVQISVSENQ